jgi:hypothetical protein
MWEVERIAGSMLQIHKTLGLFLTTRNLKVSCCLYYFKIQKIVGDKAVMNDSDIELADHFCTQNCISHTPILSYEEGLLG